MIVCVMGPSASGKSTLAKRLQELRPDRFARVPVDYFFVPRPAAMPLRDYLAQPLAYAWSTLDQALAAEGEERSTPDCDFDQFRRRADHGGLPIAEADIYLLDGMRPHPECDRLVLLELDHVTQQDRRRARDQRWGTAVADRDDHLRATFEAGLAEAPRAVDLRLDATDPIDQNARRLINFLLA